ncbi:MAG: YdjY domain-containing protein [Planctomycetota bacterium]
MGLCAVLAVIGVIPLTYGENTPAAPPVAPAPAVTPPATRPVAPPEAPPAPPTVVYLDEARTVKVDLQAKTLEIPAAVVQRGGIIELALCSTISPNARSHESCFTTPVPPSLVHAGLNLLGLKEGKPAAFAGQEALPTGAQVFVYVIWTAKAEDGTETSRRVRLEDLIFNRLTQEPMMRVAWIFCGSSMFKNKEGREIYEADAEGTVISTWRCTTTVLDNPLPEGSDDTVFFSLKEAMPPLGTPVTFLFSPVDLDPPDEQKEKGPVE